MGNFINFLLVNDPVTEWGLPSDIYSSGTDPFDILYNPSNISVDSSILGLPWVQWASIIRAIGVIGAILSMGMLFIYLMFTSNPNEVSEKKKALGSKCLTIFLYASLVTIAVFIKDIVEYVLMSV